MLIIINGIIGINLLGYCCSNKILATTTSFHQMTASSSHANTSSHCSSCNSCCSDTNSNAMNCCSPETSDNTSNSDSQLDNVSRGCSQHQYVQLKPVKSHDYVASFVAPLPSIIKLFDFSPETNSTAEHLTVASNSPPNLCGREILAMNATLLI